MLKLVTFFVRIRLAALLVLVVSFSGCFTNDFDQPTPTGLPELTYRNLHAPGDPGTWDLATGVFTPSSYQRWVFFNLKSGQVVDPADSNTTIWDIAFKGPRIYVNSGISGRGDAAAVVQEIAFENALTVPEDAAFRQDQPGGDGNLAISAIAGTAIPNVLGWRNERPISGGPTWARMTVGLNNRTIFVRCTNGWFAKLQVLSFHQGNPTIDQIVYNPNDLTLTSPAGGYYSFRWVVQPNGRVLQ